MGLIQSGVVPLKLVPRQIQFVNRSTSERTTIMNKQAAAVLALGFAGAAITCLFAVMCFKTDGNAVWGMASLITGFVTLGGLWQSTRGTESSRAKECVSEH
jgi:hypothetical protein